MKAIDIARAALQNIATRTIDDQVVKGIRSSGRSAQSLNVNMQDDGGELKGSAYFYQQIFGRRPGKRPPIQDIVMWILDKGIPTVDISLRGLAFVIARKIGEMGTDIFRGLRPGLEFSKIVKEESKQAAEDIAKGTVEDLIGVFKSLHELSKV